MWKLFFVTFLTSLVCLSSCKESKKEVESVPDTAIESSELKGYSDKFKRIILTEEGILRGFSFVTDSSEIRKNESAQFLSSTGDQMSYTVEFNDLEMADIIYHLKGNEIDTFEIDLYLKNKSITDSLLNDFNTFYSKKYGNVIKSGDSLFVWKDSIQNVEVKLKNINQDVDHGINIYLYPYNAKELVQ
jgi:hypothetical protein